MRQGRYKVSITDVHKSYDLILLRSVISFIKPEACIGPLIRKYFVIRCCIAGHGRVFVNGKLYSVSAGDCYVCLPGDVITEEAVGENLWVLSLLIYGIKAEALFKGVGITHDACLFPRNQNRALIDFAFQTVIEPVRYTASISPAEELTYISLGYSLFALLNREYRQNVPDQQSEPLRERYIHEAIYYMDLNYDKRLTVQDIAAHLGLNKSYFQRIFREDTGVTPWEYVINLRVSRACELLAYPHATIDSIANSLSWEPSVLHRNFKRIIGATPSQYRKELQRMKKQEKSAL